MSFSSAHNILRIYIYAYMRIYNKYTERHRQKGQRGYVVVYVVYLYVYAEAREIDPVTASMDHLHSLHFASLYLKKEDLTIISYADPNRLLLDLGASRIH